MEHDPAHQSRGRNLTRPRPLSRSGGEGGAEAGAERFVIATEGGVSHPTLPFFAVFVRVFRPRPCDPIRASGEGKYGSDPPLSTAGADRRRGGYHTGYHTRYHTPPHAFGGGVAPVLFIPAGRLPGPRAAGRRRARCLTDSSARCLSSAASVSRALGRGPARSQTAIPWRCSSASTRRCSTAPSSPGTTWCLA